MQLVRQVISTKSCSRILSRPAFRTTWCGSGPPLPPLGQHRMQYRFFWPAEHQYPSTMTIGAAGFGVSQAVFTTMNSLSFTMNPDAATNGAGGGSSCLPELDFAVSGVELYSSTAHDTLTIGDFTTGQDGWVPTIQGTGADQITTSVTPAAVYYEMNWGITSMSGNPDPNAWVSIQKSWNATGQAPPSPSSRSIIMYG